jgi:hypothetical protein
MLADPPAKSFRQAVRIGDVRQDALAGGLLTVATARD